MQFTNGDITRIVIIIALIVIIYYFYQEKKLLAEENKLEGATADSDSFVAGMWEGDDSIYRARARAYSWCPPGDCAEKQVYAEDLVSVNPFRWPYSGGNYYMGHTEKIKYRSEGDSKAGESGNAASPTIKSNTANASDTDSKQQQDHETFTN